MSDQINRLFEIILRLPRYPRSLTVDRIHKLLDAEGIYVDIRTIQRDMLLLERALNPRISSQKCQDKTVRWFYTKDAEVINPKGLTINQALTFNLLQKYLSPLFPATTLEDLEPFFEEAKTTLENLQGNPVLEWPKKIAIVQPTQTLLPPSLDPIIQSTITEALLKNRQLEIKLPSPKSD